MNTLPLPAGPGSTAYSSSKKENPEKKQVKRTNSYAVPSEERDVAMEYAVAYSDSRLRAFAWEMINEGIVCLSPSMVYNILREVDLIRRREEESSTTKENMILPLNQLNRD